MSSAFFPGSIGCACAAPCAPFINPRCCYATSSCARVLLKGFKDYAMSLTRRIIEHAQGKALQADRPWRYLGSTNISKEKVIDRILRTDPVHQGLVAILRCVEPCQTYQVRDRKPVLHSSRCMHLYFYHLHPIFGLMHLRLQPGFPFQSKFASTGAPGWPGRWIGSA
jgi:hypothetical protein